MMDYYIVIKNSDIVLVLLICKTVYNTLFIEKVIIIFLGLRSKGKRIRRLYYFLFDY